MTRLRSTLTALGCAILLVGTFGPPVAAHEIFGPLETFWTSGVGYENYKCKQDLTSIQEVYAANPLKSVGKALTRRHTSCADPSELLPVGRFEVSTRTYAVSNGLPLTDPVLCGTTAGPRSNTQPSNQLVVYIYSPACFDGTAGYITDITTKITWYGVTYNGNSSFEHIF